jgi:MFS family permease
VATERIFGVHRRRGFELTGSAAAWTASALVAVLFMGSTLLTPLYGVYRQAFGFSRIALTLLYSVYVIGNLAALLLFGRLSDRLGRRRISMLALGLAAASTLLFLLARSLAWLFLARVLSGFSVGLGVGAATAWIAELMGARRRPAAAAATTVANMLGLAFGPALAGPLAQYSDSPLRLPFVAYLGVLAAMAALIAKTCETVARAERGAGALPRPRLGVPARIRGQFLAPAIALFGTMALVGFYAALAPTVLKEDLRQDNLAVASGIVCELFVLAAIAVAVTRRLPSRTSMLAGLALFVPSLALLTAAQSARSMPLFVAGAAVTGLACALSYRGSLEVISQIAPADRRAEVVSTYFVAGFAGNAIPVVGIGVISTLAGEETAAVTFAAVLAAFAIGALAWDLVRARPRARAAAAAREG